MRYQQHFTGPGYREDAIFNLTTMQPYSIERLYTAFSKVTEDVVLYLPRTSNLNHLAKCGKEGKKFQAVHYCMNGASKVSHFWPLQSTLELNFNRRCVRTLATLLKYESCNKEIGGHLRHYQRELTVYLTTEMLILHQGASVVATARRKLERYAQLAKPRSSNE
jgi:hypothetical protein